jgi:hypothetical protein
MSEIGNILLGGEHSHNIGLPGSDIWLYTYQQLPVMALEPTDLFQPSCVLVVTGELDNIEYPPNTYSTNYPYCRTAIRVAMDDFDASPLFGTVKAFAPIVAVRLRLQECGVEAKATAADLSANMEEVGCAVAAFISPATGYVYVMVDTSQILLPLRVDLTLRTATRRRTGYLRILGA